MQYYVFNPIKNTFYRLFITY